MFDIFFAYPKVSKWKKTLERARCRLRILKNRRQAIATQLRKDLAELLQSGYQETAIQRVGYLIEDESMVAAYELLDHFCEVILKRLWFIRRLKECPDDINEAVSSLIFASARCGDLPELYAIRKLFEKRYGLKFATAAAELYSGNLVNEQVKEHLSVKCVPYDVKYRIVEEIARNNCLQLQPKVLAIEYNPDWPQSQVKEYEGYQLVEETQESEIQLSETNAGSKVHHSEDKGMERDIICVDSSMSNTSDNFSLPESCLTDAYALVSTVLQYPSPKAVEKLVEESHKIVSSSASDMENKGEVMALVSSSEIVPSVSSYAEGMVDYEESHFSSSEEHGFCQDTIQFGCDEPDMDQDELMSEKLSIRSSRKTQRVPKKRSRRRSSLFENQCLMDIGYMIYYHKPYRTPSVQNTHSYPQKRFKQYSSPQKEKGSKRKSLNFDMCDCRLDQPCYCCFYDDEKDCLEDLSTKLKTDMTAAYDQSKTGMELVTIPQKPDRESNYYSGEVGDTLLITYPDYHSGKSNNEMKLETSLVRSDFPNVVNRTGRETEVHYSRALSMTLESHKNCNDKILRTYSYSAPQRPKHVHPKLPDYDDLYAKFTVLKRERLENKDNRVENR